MKRFSVILPIYRSHQTLAACLKGLFAQDFPDYEVILIDSSPDDASLRIAEKFAVRLIRSDRRLWMHEARQLGIDASQGEFLVFSDPDCIAAPDWLERIDQAARRGHDLIGGAIACSPGGYWANVAHQVKFWLWLPGSPPSIYARPPFDSLATANMAIRRKWYETLGGFDHSLFSADTLLCFQSKARGTIPYFQSLAVVEHIHGNTTLRILLRERWQRSQDFYRMRQKFEHWPSAIAIIFLLGWPLLVVRALFWRFMHAWRTRTLAPFLFALPWILLCECCWMLGQTLAAIRFKEHRGGC